MAKGEMTEREAEGWADGLARTDLGRVVVIRELLRYAVSDNMSPEDKVICVAELYKLERKLGLVPVPVKPKRPHVLRKVIVMARPVPRSS